MAVKTQMTIIKWVLSEKGVKVKRAPTQTHIYTQRFFFKQLMFCEVVHHEMSNEWRKKSDNEK